MTGRGRVARLLAIWFGCGLSPVAPGTVGSLGALPIYFALRGAGPLALLAAAALVTAVGAWAAGEVCRQTKLVDPQIVVIDEVAGTLVALAAATPAWGTVAVAVLAFRVFDITKPWPARPAERLPDGWGVMVDDVVAGVWAAFVVLGLRAAGVLA